MVHVSEGERGVYISMKCDNNSYRMFKYQMLNDRKEKLAVSISLSFLFNFVLTEVLFFKQP